VNGVERLVRGLDGVQQRHRLLGFAVAVVKKFGDDRCSSLAALLAYYGFISIFPLLLLLTTVLGFVGNRHLTDSVVGSALAEFPVVGQQIGQNAAHPLTGSAVALAVGLLGLLYGSLGVAQAGQHAFAQVWNVPGVVRPGLLPRLARSVLFLVVLAAFVVTTALVSGVATVRGQPGAARVLLLIAETVLNVGVYVAVFRVLTPKAVHTTRLLPGAVLGGLAYTALLTAGTALIQRQLRHAQPLYGQFAFVLGLLAWLALVAQLTLYAAEINVVSARGLWPRSIVQPPLTPADQQVLHDIARQEERRPEQRVGVWFAPDAAEDAPDARTPAADEPPDASF
jgi:YihY family inner membrane protein